MKVLLTGGSGFIGRKTHDCLLGAGHDVVHLVRRPRGFQSEAQWDFVSPLPRLPHAIDVAIHMAAHVDFGPGMNKALYEINTISTSRLARLCASNGIKLIFASMAGVHGNAGHFTSTSPIDPQNHYAMSKYLAERLIEDLGCSAHVLRIGGIYGVGGPSHLGLNRAITNAVCEGIAPVLYGDGEGQRNYLSVDDVARWIASLAETPLEEEQCCIHMLAGAEVMTIRQWLETIMAVFFPGEALRVELGGKSADCIIEPSKPPFSLGSFRDYLRTLLPDGGANG